MSEAEHAARADAYAMRHERVAAPGTHIDTDLLRAMADDAIEHLEDTLGEWSHEYTPEELARIERRRDKYVEFARAIRKDTE